MEVRLPGAIQLIDEAETQILVDRTLGGDPMAWGTLVEAHGPAVWKLCSHLVQSSSDAEDLYQDTFERAQDRLRQFRHGSFRSWLLQICRNRWRDDLDRRRVRAGELSIDGLADSPNGGALAAVQRRGYLTVGDHQAAVVRALDVRAALDSLDPQEREALVLIKMLELDSEEAARIIGAPASTVRSRMGRARDKLQALLAEYRWEAR